MTGSLTTGVAGPVASYRDSLPPGDLVAFPIGSLDRFGFPVWSATLWSGPERPAQHGLGYGRTEEQALTSALGELTEGVAADDAMRRLPRVEGSYARLRDERGERGVLDPVRACLPAGSGWRPEVPLPWVEATRRATGEPVLVPEELVASSPSDLPARRDLLTLPITNGLGAGPEPERALSHALLELVQRDGNSVAYRALDRGVVVELDAVADPGTRALLERLEAEDVEVLVKLASTEFGMANLYVVGRERDPERAGHPLMLTACGEAVHPDREQALRKALDEYLSSRARKTFVHGPFSGVDAVAPERYRDAARRVSLEGEEERALAAMVAWLRLDAGALEALIADPVLSRRERVAFSSLPTVPPGSLQDPERLAAVVAGRLESSGLDVLEVDLSVPGTGVAVVRAIVPGLEVETISYGRIGTRNLCRLLAWESGLVALGAAPRNGRRILLPRDAEEELGGPAWLDAEALDRVLGRLYPLYREPARHRAPLATAS